MNSLRAQNAIIDLLRGVVNDVHTIDITHENDVEIVHSTVDPTSHDPDSEGEIKGGAPAIDAIENVFLAGGNPNADAERDEFADIAEQLASQNNIEGGDAKPSIEPDDLEGGDKDQVDSSNDSESSNKSDDIPDDLEGGDKNNDDVSDNNEAVEAEDFEPIDVDGKEPVNKDDEGDVLEDKFDSDNDNEEEESDNEFDMKGGATIQRVHMITADTKFPFILKSRHSK